MFERFTEQARRTLFFGRYAVTERGGARFDPEHVLLGAIRDPTALLPLQFTPATLNAMEEALVASVAGGEKLATSVEVPSPRTPRLSSNTPPLKPTTSDRARSIQRTCCWAFS